MEFIIEQFNLDMRKLDLYIENAENEYLFACEEASLYDDSDVIVNEAEESFGSKVKNFFSSLIQKIRETVAKIIEKLKELFTRKKAEEVAKTIQSNPELANQKIQIPDVKKIEDACGKRKLLLKSLVKKAEAGKLTEDDLEKAVEKYDKYTKIAKGVGLVTVAAGSVVGLIFLKNHVSKNKENVGDSTADIENLSRSELRQRRFADILKGKNAKDTYGVREQHVAKYVNGMKDITPDLQSHRELSKLIALDATDTAALDAKIASYTLDELVKLDKTIGQRNDKLIARTSGNKLSSKRRKDVDANVAIANDIGGRVAEVMSRKIKDEQNESNK